MIHSFKLNGYNIVLDVASGSVHSVDDVAYDVINLYETKSRKEIVKEKIKRTFTHFAKRTSKSASTAWKNLSQAENFSRRTSLSPI